MIRKFIPGSEWLYYKIYAAPQAVDTVVLELLYGFAESLAQREIVEKWFFIRYDDPENHLRIRFLLKNRKFLNLIMMELNDILDPLLTADVIWNVKIDVYKRELERYGKDTMEFSESIFWHDSKACLNFLQLIEGQEGEKLRWLFGLKSIDTLLDGFSYTLEDKLYLLSFLKDGFNEEFKMDKFLRKQINSKYGSYRNEINHFLLLRIQDAEEYMPILNILNEYENNVALLVKTLKEKQGDFEKKKRDFLLSSYIHMLMNRLFQSKNRTHELVCYNFLFKYYTTQKVLLDN